MVTSTNFDAVTAQYVDVRLDRKKTLLETYHKALHPQTEEGTLMGAFFGLAERVGFARRNWGSFAASPGY